MQIWSPKAFQNEIQNPGNPILKNDLKICPKKEGGALLEQGEVTHTLLKGGTAASSFNSRSSFWPKP